MKREGYIPVDQFFKELIKKIEDYYDKQDKLKRVNKEEGTIKRKDSKKK